MLVHIREGFKKGYRAISSLIFLKVGDPHRILVSAPVLLGLVKGVWGRGLKKVGVLCANLKFQRKKANAFGLWMRTLFLGYNDRHLGY